MKLITFFFWMSISIHSFSQNQLSGNIQKKFSIGNKEMTEAHQTDLRLYDLKTKTWSGYYTTDTKGTFSIQDVKPGQYLLQVNDQVVKQKNIVFIEVPSWGKNQVHPILVDRIKKKVIVK